MLSRHRTTDHRGTHSLRKYDVVLSGHTHRSSVTTVGNTLAVNPGSVHGFEEEENNAMVAILDTKTKKVEILPLL
ncbi:hypothetical protein EXS65_00800 [Candidatus Peribacteria bacterium]|nr:hypothetical protein [Candidatus Peribacteria bacterium]